MGKSNVPEFAAGSHTFNTVFGVTRNPYDLERSAGGSSGGSAAALACGLVALADGSDLGGSLRNPASFCNVVGFRPSPGLVPSPPGASGATYLSHAVHGPMGRTVADAALLLEVLSGVDRRASRARPDRCARGVVPGVRAAVRARGPSCRRRRRGRCSRRSAAASWTPSRTSPVPTRRSRSCGRGCSRPSWGRPIGPIPRRSRRPCAGTSSAASPRARRTSPGRNG